MKTIQPKDYSKTPDQYLIDSRMSVSEQKQYLRNAIARLVVFGFLLWLAAWGFAGWWSAFYEVVK